LPSAEAVDVMRAPPTSGVPGPIPALELFNLRAGYGRLEVLHGVTLAVPAGSVVALMGPNGAGKTTLLNVCAGVVPVGSGCVHVAGRHVNGVAADTLARAGVCSVPEARGVFPNLTIRENLRVFTHAAGPLAEVEERSYKLFPRLGERRHQLAGTLSGGERQMLAMVRALVGDPVLLLLDEISMGLAPIIVAQMYEKVAELAAGGLAILLVEQFATAALGVADYAAVLRQGRLSALGRPDEVAGSLSDAYLGILH
jgi:branched-chain amino acid transport system ATP-binding protein